MSRFILGGAVGTTVMTLMMYFLASNYRWRTDGHRGRNWIKDGRQLVAGHGSSRHDWHHRHPAAAGFCSLKILAWANDRQRLADRRILFWLVTMLVIMPSMGKGLFLSATGEGPKAIVAAFMAHAVYGLLLGLIAGLGLKLSNTQQPAA